MIPGTAARFLLIGAVLTWGCGRTSLISIWDAGGPSETTPSPTADGGVSSRGDGGVPAGPFDGGGTPPASDGGAPQPPGDLGFPTAGPTDATNFRIDAAHTGAQPLETITPPLTIAWSFDAGAPVTYPLVVNDTVFVTGGGWNLNLQPGSVTALDRVSGATRWGPLAPGNGPLAAYDRGALFVITFDGLLFSIDATTGRTNWSITLADRYLLWAPPVALDGVVYVAGTWAVAESTGTVLWHAPYYGTAGAVAVADGLVLGGESAGQASAVDAINGQELWHHTTGQGGGGGATPVVFGGRLYVRDVDWRQAPWGDQLLDEATGALLGTFRSLPPPAFAAGVGYFLDDSKVLSAVSLSSGGAAWTFTGDGTLTTAPLVAGAYVFVGSSSGNLYALDSSGQVTWTTTMPQAINANQQNTSMVVAEGTLFVPVGNQLFALH